MTASGRHQRMYHGPSQATEQSRSAAASALRDRPRHAWTRSDAVSGDEEHEEASADPEHRYVDERRDVKRDARRARKAELVADRNERVEPRETEEPGSHDRDGSEPEREPEPRGPRAGLPVGEHIERHPHQGHPLDRDRQHPENAGDLSSAAPPSSQGPEEERDHPNVVVPAACEVQREERVPADERGCVGLSPGAVRGEPDDREHRERGEELVEPDDACPGVDEFGLRFGCRHEDGPVPRRIVVPGCTTVRVCRVLEELAWRVVVRALVGDRGDPAGLPVAVRICREEQRHRKRGQLDRRGNRHHGCERCAASSYEPETQQKQQKSPRDRADEDPTPDSFRPNGGVHDLVRREGRTKRAAEQHERADAGRKSEPAHRNNRSARTGTKTAAVKTIGSIIR